MVFYGFDSGRVLLSGRLLAPVRVHLFAFPLGGLTVLLLVSGVLVLPRGPTPMVAAPPTAHVVVDSVAMHACPNHWQGRVRVWQ